MTSHAMTVQAGYCYWVEVDGHRFGVKAVEPVNLPGWWRWTTEDGRELILHESRVVEERNDDPTALNWSDT